MVYDDMVPPINERNVRALMTPSQRWLPLEVEEPARVHSPPWHGRLHRWGRRRWGRKSMDLAGFLVRSYFFLAYALILV